MHFLLQPSPPPLPLGSLPPVSPRSPTHEKRFHLALPMFVVPRMGARVTCAALGGYARIWAVRAIVCSPPRRRMPHSLSLLSSLPSFHTLTLASDLTLLVRQRHPHHVLLHRVRPLVRQLPRRPRTPRHPLRRPPTRHRPRPALPLRALNASPHPPSLHHRPRRSYQILHPRCRRTHP
ncbi:hypothetical protein AAT19DRAFT_15917 [Rhodotorula toruloides]|uniref:Uncharacterized protein n=1 Tax=Rhodotorula toruloides TaxID=5286 RepID=A0A2T0A566_RHOTO|nr:hypothetical protein AAT19DRAFT_15917 [Rhodotorula toruloides]